MSFFESSQFQTEVSVTKSKVYSSILINVTFTKGFAATMLLAVALNWRLLSVIPRKAFWSLRCDVQLQMIPWNQLANGPHQASHNHILIVLEVVKTIEMTSRLRMKLLVKYALKYATKS